MARYRFTVLGCGSSGGVPRLAGGAAGGAEAKGGTGAKGNGGPKGDWGSCDPANPKNRRRRCSLLVERETGDGVTRVLIDTSPDMREQLLDAGVGVLDGVVFTHSHADHTHGIDDLRQVVFNLSHRLPVWADAPTQEALISRFGYAFIQPAGSPYPPILDLRAIDGPVEVEGAGGTVRLRPFTADHGSMEALGFRIGGLAYLPDAVAIPPESWEVLQGLDCWVVDALRRKPHPTHAHLAMTLDWIGRAAPGRAVLTNMHLDMDYDTLCAELPDGVIPAHDGLVLSFDDWS